MAETKLKDQSGALKAEYILIPAVDPSSNTNWNTFAYSSSSFLSISNTSSGAQNDEIKFSRIMLKAGTYTINILHSKGPNRGIYTVKLDTTTLGTIDGYFATTNTADIGSFSSVSVTTDGFFEISLKMTSKNASSSSYYGVLSAISIKKTA